MGGYSGLRVTVRIGCAWHYNGGSSGTAAGMWCHSFSPLHPFGAGQVRGRGSQVRQSRSAVRWPAFRGTMSRSTLLLYNRMQNAWKNLCIQFHMSWIPAGYLRRYVFHDFIKSAFKQQCKIKSFQTTHASGQIKEQPVTAGTT